MGMFSFVQWRTISAPEDVCVISSRCPQQFWCCPCDSQPFSRCGTVSQVVLVYSSLVANDVEHSSLYLFAVWLFYWNMCSCLFVYLGILFLVLSSENCLCTLRYRLSSNRQFENFSCSMACLVILFSGSAWTGKCVLFQCTCMKFLYSWVWQIFTY